MLLLGWMDKRMTGPQRRSRQGSARSIKFLQENEGGRAGVRTSWRERVRPIEAPAATASKKHERPPSAADKVEGTPEPFNLERLSGDLSSRDIHVCVNGKLSESPESAELTRTFARWKRTGSIQSEGSQEDFILEEVLRIEDLLLTSQDQADGVSQGRQKVPLCWDDLPLSTLKPSGPVESSDDQSKKVRHPKKGTEEIGDSVKQLVSPLNMSPSHVASCRKESSLALDVMVTWGDQCLLPWQLHYTQTHPEDFVTMQCAANSEVRIPSPSLHLEVSGKYAGSPERSSGHQLVENILNHSKGAGRLIGVAKRENLNDLLCFWLRQPIRGEKVQSVKLESCSFNVCLSETLDNGKTSTRVFKEVLLRKVVHNLFVFKFHLVSSLPWITDVCQLSRRTLGVSIYLSRPEQFEGLVVADRITLTPNPHIPSSPPGADQTSPRQAQHQPQTNQIPRVEPDEDKITLAVDSAVLDTASQQAQDFILSFYHNPYQVGTHTQEKTQRGKQEKRLRNSQTQKEAKPYTKLVQKHLGKFLDKSPCAEKAADSGRQTHILVCSSSSHIKQKKGSRRHRSPRVVLPSSSEGGGGDSVRSALSCQRLGFLHQHGVGQKQDTIEEEAAISWRSAVTTETTDSLTS